MEPVAVHTSLIIKECRNPGYQKEVVYTNTGAQVDSENAPRVLHLAVIFCMIPVTQSEIAKMY